MQEQQNIVEIGTIAEIKSHPIGLVYAVANIKMTDQSLNELWDAAILIGRKTFGHGRLNITLRRDMWCINDDVLRASLAKDAANQLFSGSANSHEQSIIADILLNMLDDLKDHPPESIAKLRKEKLNEMDRDGLILRVDDKVLISAEG